MLLIIWAKNNALNNFFIIKAVQLIFLNGFFILFFYLKIKYICKDKKWDIIFNLLSMKNLLSTIVLSFILILNLCAQSSVEELFYISFDVDAETAKDYRKQIIEKSPGSMYAMYCEGWFKTKSDSAEDALNIANKLVEKYPDFVFSYLLRGNCHFYLKDYAKAMQEYNKVIQLDPKESGGFHNRGVCKYFLEDYRGAITDYDKALELDSNFAKTYYRRGLAKIKIGRIDDGCLDLSKAGEMGFLEAYDEIKKQCR
ncbi:MAG: Tetratricopeptide repeat protein [Bacteroidetes bacterium ADurb.Bin408]|nr:MAG: Tetratricopeptide repeat protein [Bacteroidetes bacterium ADurb.Bin408]